jgi:hypothetical protein
MPTDHLHIMGIDPGGLRHYWLVSHDSTARLYLWRSPLGHMGA